MIGKTSTLSILFLAAAQLALATPILPAPRMECSCVCGDESSSAKATAYMVEQAIVRAKLVGFMDDFNVTPDGAMSFSGQYFSWYSTPKEGYQNLIDGCKTLEGMEGAENYTCDAKCDVSC